VRVLRVASRAWDRRTAVHAFEAARLEETATATLKPGRTYSL
jgi:hypothetical protein